MATRHGAPHESADQLATHLRRPHQNQTYCDDNQRPGGAGATNRMAARQRTGSALSVTSDLDRQLNELMVDEDEQEEEEENRTAGERENVAVMVRCRPLAAGERAQGEPPPVQVDEANRCVQVEGTRRFFYDQVFAPATSSEQVYMRSARRLVEAAFRGYNCTIFLYGQTGTGKTYTHSSLTLATFEHLFSLIQDSNRQARFLIRASYYELYNEEIRDLLAAKQPRGAPGGLELHESRARGVYVKDLSCYLVNNPRELVKLKQLGDKRRATAATRMNEHSSRSHSIFSITVEATTSAAAAAAGSAKRAADGKSSLRLGRLHLIDLAGSERQSKSGSSGQQLREASRINLSLTCLSLVIRALTDKSRQGHIPYRNSKLTRLLSSSLGGNSKTLLLACVSPAAASLDETLNTLRFAARTKRIKNKAVINEDPKDALLRKYRRQLVQLREELSQTQRQEQQQQSARDGPGDSGPESGGRARLDRQQQQVQLAGQLELLKAKVMFGGENLLAKAELHERLLEASRRELEDRQQAEARLRDQLHSKEHALKSVARSRGGLESQRLNLEEKLARAVSLYRRSKLELRDLSSEHEQLKEQLLLTIRSTSKEIKYTDCILDDFVPHEHLDLINACAQHDDESDEWQIKYIALSGNNISQTRRLAAGRPASVEVPPGSAARAAGLEETSPPATRPKRARGARPPNNRPDPFIRL